MHMVNFRVTSRLNSHAERRQDTPSVPLCGSPRNVGGPYGSADVGSGRYPSLHNYIGKFTRVLDSVSITSIQHVHTWVMTGHAYPFGNKGPEQPMAFMHICLSMRAYKGKEAHRNGGPWLGDICLSLIV